MLPKADGCPVSELATAGLDSIAVRVPAHPVARDLLKAFGKPVVAPSANQSGHVSPTTAEHVRADLDGRIDLIVDGGATSVGIESTIVSCLDEPTLLRPGGLPREDIERVLGHALLDLEQPMSDEAPLAPGMLASHYAPRTPLRLNARDVRAGRGAARIRRRRAARRTRALNLSASGDLVEAAANLFSHLRALDASGARAIAVMPIPNEGLGEAINDRLARAAAPDDSNGLAHEPARQAARLVRPAPPLRRDRRRALRHHRSGDAGAVSQARCATSITATRRWCCGRARSRRCRRS